MEIVWFGQACFRLKGKAASVVIDPYFPDFVGLKLPKELEAQAVLVTHPHQDHNNVSVISGNPVIVNGPGEYEISGVAINGVSVFHDKEQGAQRGKNTVYNVQIDGLSIVHLGDLGHILTEGQVEEIGKTDILLIPVGGVYTIDGKDATEIVAQLEPKIVIPMHYGGVPGLKIELDPVDNFLKEMGVENPVPLAKLSIHKEKLPDEMQVVILAKS